MPLERVPYADQHAPHVASWPRGPEERALWASRPDLVVDAELLRAWSSAPGVAAFTFLESGVPCAYAELWLDEEAGEAELAHILVAPAQRRRGIGRAVVASLVSEARARGFAAIWLRVAPENLAAIACYERAGLVRTTPDREAVFNRGQPRAYVWMTAPRSSL